MKAYSDIIKQAKRPERTVELCLRADLVAELEDAQRRLAEAREERTSFGDDGGLADIKADIDRIKAEAKEHSIVFRFRALSPKGFRDLITANPPRPDNDADKRAGYHQEAVAAALVKACCYEPALSDDEWATLIGADDDLGDGVLSPSQWGRLDTAVSELNFGRREIPF